MSENRPRESAEVTSDHVHDVALRDLYEYLDRDLTWHIINNYEHIDDTDPNKMGLINRLTDYYKRLGGAGSDEDARRWAMNTISMVKGYAQKGAQPSLDTGPSGPVAEKLEDLHTWAYEQGNKKDGSTLGPRPNASGAPFTLPEGYQGASSRGTGDVGFISEGDVDENGNLLTNLGVPEGPDGDAIAAEKQKREQDEAQLFADTLGFNDLGIRSNADLPEGMVIDDYYQIQEVLGVLQRWSREGKLNEWRKRLFNAGYYNADNEGNWDFDFSTSDITNSDIKAVTSALTEANISDPTKRTLIKPHLRDTGALNKAGQVAMLETTLAGRMDDLGLATTAGGITKYVDDLMSGRSSFGSLENDMRDTAMGLYPAWADQIRGGMSMNTIAKPYRDAARSVLEIPWLAWDDPMLQAGLNARNKDGNPSSMSLTAFKDAMRDDPRWDYTQNAHDYYGDLSGAVLEAWGF